MIQINGSMPTANITVNRNRIKDYENSVYLKDKTEFEIEIFNPLTVRILASIEIDNKFISSGGIIINPGQRIYLERWIDEAKKFIFSTYLVEKNSKEVDEAITNNGKINVVFYKELSNITDFYYNLPFNYTYHNGTIPCSNPEYGANISYSSYDISASDFKETGMTDKGSNSSQIMSTTYGNFSNIPLSSISLKILPESQKPIEINKIRSYCTECGVRIRASSWKFCPSCGNKL